jgi:Leucine-rich repeat (LRR) protein/GTPase SAR1 family protein
LTRVCIHFAQALWLINEKNETLKALELSNNQVGAKAEDSNGLARMLMTSTALVHLNLSENVLGSLGTNLKAFGRGLGSNKNLTKLDVSNNQLLPDGIKVVCNALRTCTAMKDLNLSYNSPGREAALSGMLLVHPTLRSVGIVEKEPQTRSERTYWLDTRAKEAIGRALLAAPGTVQFLQCDVFALTETTRTLNWISSAACDAIVLAGVLRSNSVLTTLNVAQGEIGDYEREEIGTALLANTNGRVGFCDAYGLKEGTGAVFSVDLKNKDQIRSRRAFTLFAGVLRANSTLTQLTLASVQPEHIDVLAEALATNTTLKELVIEQPSKTTDTQITTIPIQELNGQKGNEFVDLSQAGQKLADGTFQPCHRHACGVVGAILGASKNTSIRRLKMDPGGGADGGMIVDHLNRARKSSLAVLDVTGIGLSDRGGAKFFETLIEGKLDFVHSFHIGRNELTDLAVGRLMVEALRSETCNIRTLDLNNNDIGAGIITQAIKSNSSLTQLDITGNPQIDDRGLGLIGDFLLQPSCTCRLRLINCFAFEVKDDKAGLKLHNETIGGGAMQLLCGISKYNDLIEKLDLSGRGVDTSAASVLATATKHNNTLKSINLSDNPLSDVTLYTTGSDPCDTNGLNALAEAVSVNVALVEITLDGGKLPVDELKGERQGEKRENEKQSEKQGEKRVKFLDLSKKSLGFVSAIFIGTLLRGNLNITELVLHSNQLTPKGVTFIVKQLPASLKTLDIANTVHVDERSKAEKKGDKKSTATTGPHVSIPADQVEALWAAVTTLSSIEKLTMDRDYLSDLKDIGKMLSLKTLSLSNNKLTSLPDDISRIRGLRQLVVSGNQLKVLTPAISECELLERLDLKSNQLRFLPASLSRLRNLKVLDASENLLTTLEPSVCDMHDLEKLTVNDNPLERPPSTVARQGLGAIRKHFQEIMVANQLFFHGCRMMLLGHPMSGKSTLLRAMQMGTSPKTHVYEPTMQVDMQTIVIGDDIKQKVLNVWDFAGGIEYAAGTMHYIVDGSIYIMAVPAESPKVLKHGEHNYIGRWLDTISLGAPTATIIPVLTKCDQLLEKGAHVTLSAMENATENQVEWFLQAINGHLLRTNNTSLRVEQQVFPVSSITGGESSLEALREHIGKLILSDTPVLPTIGQAVSRVLALTMVFIRALRDGRDTTDAARAQDLGYIPSMMSTEQKQVRWCIPYDEAHRLFFDEFVPALKLPVTSDEALKEGIELMCAQGEIAWGPEEMLYLRPDYITKLVGPLFDSKMGGRLWIPRVLAVAEAVRAKVIGFPMLDQERAAILSAVECLIQTGELREELLSIMWDPLGVRRHEYGDILWNMSRAGLVVLKQSTWHGRRWLMPHRLPFVPAADRLLTWTDACERKKIECLQVVLPLQIGYTPPSGVLEKFIAACQGLGTYASVWKSEEGGGAHMEIHSLNFVANLLIELKASEKGPITSNVESKLDASSFKARSTEERAAPNGVPPPQAQAANAAKDPPSEPAAGEEPSDPTKVGTRSPSKESLSTVEPATEAKAPEDESSADTDSVREKRFELSIVVCGKKATREGMWRSLVYLKEIAQKIVDEVPGLPKGADSALCCPQCLEEGKLPCDAGQLPVKMLMKQEVVCEACDATLSLEGTDMSEKCVMGLTSNNSLIVEPVPDVRGPPLFRRSQDYWTKSTSRAKYCANRLRMGRPLEDRTSLWKLLGLPNQEAADKLKADGEKAIQEEMVKYSDSFPSIEALKASRDEYEWTDYDWSRYLSDKPKVEDLDEDMVKPTFLALEKLAAKAEANGFDKDRLAEKRTLDFLCAEKICVAAGLSRAHVLSLRIYSSSVANTINSKLQDGCSPARPHPYPALVLNLAEAAQKLGAAQHAARQAAAAKAKQLAEAARKIKSDEDVDDADKVKAAKLAAEAADASAALQCTVFWRGVSHLQPEEFVQRNGYEAGFTSTSQQRSQAAQDALKVFLDKRSAEAETAKVDEEERLHPKVEEEQQTTKVEPPVLLFRISPAANLPPADISFLSVFPKESEWIYPPGLILENRLAWKDNLGETDDGEKVECTIVEALPSMQRREDAKKKGTRDATEATPA